MNLIRRALFKTDSLLNSDTIINYTYKGIGLTLSKQELEIASPTITALEANIPTTNVFNINLDKIWVFEAKIKLISEFIDNNELIIPEKERRECEKAIEYAAKATSVCLGVPFQLLSPSHGTDIDFEAETELESQILAGATKKILTGGGMVVHCSNPDNLNAHFLLFEDRLEGLSLASDALNHQSHSGAFRDYIRLFESAFRCPMSSLDKTLNKFLNQDMNYTRQEILTWSKLRHSLSHADRKKSDTTLLSSDALKYIPRIRQAALDVLLNKRDWASKSTLRRPAWTPQVFSRGLEKPFIAQEGSRVKLSSMDSFGAFEKSWNVKLKMADK